jgi:hypothetical protein
MQGRSAYTAIDKSTRRVNKHPNKYHARSLSATQQRLPLQPRDDNAMMRGLQKGSPLTTKSGNAMAPSDRQNATTRPGVITSNPPVIKSTNKTPLTPRVAVSNASPLSTPLTRRPTRQETHPGLASPQLNDVTSPVTPLSSFFNNVTPRSSSRRTRGVDSGNSTPTHTPTGVSTPDLPRSAGDGHTPTGTGAYIAGYDNKPQRRSVVSFSPAISEVGSQRETASTTSDTKFFYASDAKTVSQPRQQRPALESMTSAFFYANGDAIPTPVPASSSSRSVVGLTPTEERKPLFFHADGNPEAAAQQLPGYSSASSTLSSAYPAPRLAPRTPTLATSPLQRPPSPSKLNQSSTALVPAPSQPVSAIVTSPGIQDSPAWKGTVGEVTRPRFGHERTTSVPKLTHERPPSAAGSDKASSTRRLSNATTLSLFPLASPASPTRAIITVPSFDAVPITEHDEDDSSKSGVQSPTKAGFSLERMNELAANARRERKVLDLEITNSSLAAINRTLEREMRKQTAELRRYRRLSRSGRLSIATTASMRTSNGMSITSLSDMSEEDSEEDEEEDESSEEESDEDGSLSPGARAESDARHRKRDERRLQLDLTKHQQLLTASQNMNQSLKRCMTWTEELISEGKKALAYKVNVSDIQLGGRVLAPEEVDDTDDVDHPRHVIEPAVHNVEYKLETWHRPDDLSQNADSRPATSSMDPDGPTLA